MPEEKTDLQKLMERLDLVEKSIKEKDDKITELEQKNAELEKKVASYRVTSLVTEVKPSEQKEEDEITFDFDM